MILLSCGPWWRVGSPTQGIWQVRIDRWFSHRLVHWVFPRATCASKKVGAPTAVTFRTAVDFMTEDTFGMEA